MRWSYHHAVTLPLPQSEAFNLMTQYDALPEILEGITWARILTREGDITVLVLRGPLLDGSELVLELVHSPCSSVVFAQADRYRQRGCTGQVRIQPSPEDPECSTLTLDLHIPIGLLSFLARAEASRQAERCLEALRSRAEHTAAVRDQDQEETPRLILQLVKGESSLDVTLHGQTYQLALRPEDAT